MIGVEVDDATIRTLRENGWLIVPERCVSPALRHRAMAETGHVPGADRALVENVWRLQRAVAQVTGVAWDRLAGRQRAPDILHARRIAMFLAVERLGYTQTLVARAFGRADHSTIGNAVSRIRAMPDAQKEQLAPVMARIMSVYDARGRAAA